jgi:5-methylcytosine-specific restriction endonuclease McrA
VLVALHLLHASAAFVRACGVRPHRSGARGAAFPIILEQLSCGALTLTAVGMLAPHLTADNHSHVLDSARHKTKREVEQLVATLRPQPDVPAAVRKLPTPKPSTISALSIDSIDSRPGSRVHTAATAPSIPRDPPRPIVVALAPERFKVQFTVSRETHDKLRRVQGLLRHQVPNGDLPVVFDRALTVLLEHLEKTKLAKAQRPRTATTNITHSRHIPAAIKRAVWKRDGGRCAFVGSSGRCAETNFLEFHHIIPYAAGGETSTDNVKLSCRAHNAFEAERYFGPRELPLVREERGEFG